MFITGPGMYAVGINHYSKVFIIHKNMVCCGLVACSITSDLYVTMEACLKSLSQGFIWGWGVGGNLHHVASVSLPLGN